MPRGGRRQGTPGKAYGNRTDLNGGKLPVQAATGQPYGKAGEQQAAQRALPMGSPSLPPSGEMPLPGSAGPLDQPSGRPDEPVTAGLPVGPGPGPEALGLPEEGERADLAAMWHYLPTLEVMAAQPNTTPSFRAYVRRLRGAMPAEQPRG